MERGTFYNISSACHETQLWLTHNIMRHPLCLLWNSIVKFKYIEITFNGDFSIYFMSKLIYFCHQCRPKPSYRYHSTKQNKLSGNAPDFCLVSW
jgi:hypothetical protein